VTSAVAEYKSNSADNLRATNLTRKKENVMNSGKPLFNNNRIRSVMILVLGLSLAGTARAQSSGTLNQLFAFTCSGGIIGADKCPQGGRPNVIIQASDGNFYGVG
jgi:hypothetical protein